MKSPLIIRRTNDSRRIRRGMVTLDYILVLGVTFPIAVLLFYWLLVSLLAIYRFASLTISWPYL